MSELGYLNLMRKTLMYGEYRLNRTDIAVYGSFGNVLSYDLQEGFPAVTTKKLYFKSVAAELAGFLEGTTSAKRMRELGTHIWDANAQAANWQENPHCEGIDDLGIIYGALWRNFDGVDQLRRAVHKIKHDPYDRRIVVSAWKPGVEHKQCLPPCHIFYQFYVRNCDTLDCVFYMRSVDLFLGLPFDIASYALLTHIVAQECNLKPGKLTAFLGDTHIYVTHIKAVEQQLTRAPYPPPKLELAKDATIDNFTTTKAQLVEYKHYPALSAPMAV